MRGFKYPTPTALDRAIGVFSPSVAVERLRARTQLEVYSTMAGGYTGARRDRRQTSEWATRGGSADAVSLFDLPTLRDRSRDLVRNTPLATGAINTVTTNVVGTGLKVQSRVDRELLAGIVPGGEAGLDRWERDAERVWHEWSESEDCDATRSQCFAEIQDLAFRSTLESGDVFLLRRSIQRGDRRLRTAVQLIESDRVTNPRGRRDNRYMAGGVQLDGYGAPIRYHVLNQHPGDQGKVDRSGVWVAAFGPNSGERQVLHLFKRLRIDMTRGVPYLAPVIEPLKMLDRYAEAELMAAVVSSFFTVFVKSEGDDVGMAVAQPAAETGGGASDKDYKLASGAILDLGVNESIETANPGRPNAQFDPFVLAVLRQIGVALEIPFEILIKHFTASYSAARAAMLEAWKFFRSRREWLAGRLCDPVYGWVIAEAVARGMLVAPGFFESPSLRRAYLGTEWNGPAPGQIDPKKDADANQILVEMGVKTLTQVTAETTGGDWETNQARRAREEQIRTERGLRAEPRIPEPAGQNDDTSDLEIE